MAGGASVGVKVGIEGDKQFKDAVSTMTAQAKALSAEMDAVSKGFVEAGDSSTEYERKQTVLNKQIEQQKTLIQTLHDALENSKNQYGENSKQTAQWQEKLNKAQGDLATMQKNLDGVVDGEEEYNKETETATKKTSMFGEVLKAELISKAIIEGIKSLADGFKKVGEAVTGAFTDSVKWADELNTLSQQTSISTQTLQEWEYMAKLIDVDVNTLTASNTKLIRTMSSAQGGTKSAVDAFSTLGVAFQNADGTLRNSESVMMEVITALGNVANETERDALAMSIFGKSAQELNPLILTGAEGMASLAQEAHQVGYVLDEDAVGSLNRTQDAMDRVELAGQGLTRQLSSQFAPVVADAFESVIPVVTKFGGTIADVFKGNKTVAEFVDEVMNSIEELIHNFEKNAPQFLEQGERLLKSLVEGIQRTVPSLIGLVVPMLTRLAQTFIQNLGTILDTGIKILLTIINGLTQALPQLISYLPTIITTVVTTLLKNLPEIIKAGVQIIVALVQGLIQMIPNLIQSAGQIISAIWNALKEAPRLMLDVGKQIVEGIWQGISNAFSWIKGKIKDWVGDVVGFFKRVLGIHSPSKVFADVVGTNIALGIGEGFDDEMTSVARSMTDAIPMSFGMSGSGSYRQTNLGGVNITVNGAEGQNVQELADEIMFRMQTAVSRREMVFA